MPPPARIPAAIQQAEHQLQRARPRQRAVQGRPVDARAHDAGDRAPPAAAPATPAAARRSSSPTSHGSGAVSERARRPSPRRDARVRARPSRTASVRLPARRSVSRSRTLLTTRIALASRPDGHRAHERLPGQLLDLHEVGARDGDDAEEQEHEHLAEALVAVGARAARVEHARRGSTRRRPRAAPARRPRRGRRRSRTARPKVT